MTPTQIVKFKTEYALIIDCNNRLYKNLKHLEKLHSWDKNGSHAKAITEVLNKRDELKAEMKTLLKGLDIDDWKILNKRIHTISLRITRATAQKEKSEKELQDLNFNL